VESPVVALAILVLVGHQLLQERPRRRS
jgi:hypothetical protein